MIKLPNIRRSGASIKKIFKSESCGNKSFEISRRQGKYCDITLVSADGTKRYVVRYHSSTCTITKHDLLTVYYLFFDRMKAHRVLLADKMNNMDTEFENSSEIQTKMDANTLNRVIQFCYKGQASVDDYKQVFYLLKAAAHYDMADLPEQCRQFLMESINTNEKLAPMFLSLSNAIAFDKLTKKCLTIVCEDFERIVNEPVFNELAANDIASILESDRLCVRNEEFVFTALMRWLVKGDNMDLDRLCSMPIPIVHGASEILTHIKFPLMDETVLFHNRLLCSNFKPK